MVKLVGAAAFLIMSAVAVAAAYSQQPDVTIGKDLAERWCSSCHLVSPEQTRGLTDAAPFAVIAKRSRGNPEAIARFLVDPHPQMPNLNLTRQEIQDLTTYIRSLYNPGSP